MSKLIYVTAKQVNEYIKKTAIHYKTTENFIIATVNALVDLKEFPNDNPNQIKFFTRVLKQLLGDDAGKSNEGIITQAHHTCKTGFMDWPDYDPEIEMGLVDALTVLAIEELPHDSELDHSDVYDWIDSIIK